MLMLLSKLLPFAPLKYICCKIDQIGCLLRVCMCLFTLQHFWCMPRTPQLASPLTHFHARMLHARMSHTDLQWCSLFHLRESFAVLLPKQLRVQKRLLYVHRRQHCTSLVLVLVLKPVHRPAPARLVHARDQRPAPLPLRQRGVER